MGEGNPGEHVPRLLNLKASICPPMSESRFIAVANDLRIQEGFAYDRA
jgi:hypothetical protein